MATKKICPVVVSYPAKDPKTGDELKFDMDYYTAKHMPLIAKVSKLLLCVIALSCVLARMICSGCGDKICLPDGPTQQLGAPFNQYVSYMLTPP